MKLYLVITGTLFGLIAAMHLMRSIAERGLLATDPWYFVGMSALGVVAAALSVWAWCLLRRQVRR
jgi:NO-binding membrane sensor protein with MHYT domain